MPVIDNGKPDFIKAYRYSHGVPLEPKSDGQYEGECPGCGKELFRVDPSTGLYNCRSSHCKVSGNLPTFLRWIYELGTTAHLSNGKTITQKYEEFAQDRSLLSPETLKYWGVFLHPVSHFWTVPGYDQRGEIMNLYVYRPPMQGDKPRLMSTAGCEHQLLGMQHFDRRKGNVWLFESFWDMIACWEVLRHTKETSKGYVYTENTNLSIESSINLVAVPGSNVFKEGWCDLLSHKVIHLHYHSDHPKIMSNGQPYIAGHEGLRKCVKMISTVEHCNPQEVKYLHWGEMGYDPERKSGYDVRDLLSGEQDDDTPEEGEVE